jgi:NADPH:quinone reductase-like Zn-dependent oxidoreductase
LAVPLALRLADLDADELSIPAADNMKTGRGALAQYAVVKEGDLAQKPTELSWEDAAGLPLVGCTAHGAIIAQGHVQAGQSIFINGGATSVGRIAIGIAKKLGATVIVSCSSASADTCKSLGADEVRPDRPAASDGSADTRH